MSQLSPELQKELDTYLADMEASSSEKSPIDKKNSVRSEDSTDDQATH